MTMQSPIKGLCCIDIKETSRIHSDIVPSVLAIHAITGCNSVAATYGIGKTKQLKWQDTATHLINLVSRWQISPTWSNNQLISWLHAIIAKHHALPWRNAASSCGHRKQESQQQHRNCVVCHRQLKHLSKMSTEHTFRWYSVLSRDPPPLNAVDYGWEADEANKCLIPRNMAEGVPYAPEHILKLVKCGCVSQRPCKGAKCGCMGHQLPCTMFCACGAGRVCLNPFNTVDTDKAVNQDVDTDNDPKEDVDEEDNV